MKQKLALLAVVLCLLLTACEGPGGEEPTSTLYDAEDVTTLLDAGIFSELPEQLDSDMGCTLLGVDESMVTECQVYLPTSTNAEALALFVLDDVADASAVETACWNWIEEQITSYQDYGPEHVPKLEGAVISVRENTVLLVVGNDPAAAKTAVDGLE